MAAHQENEITPSNPLYMHPNENPLIILVQSLLTEKNFYGWSRAVRRALISKNKLGFVDGTLPCPPDLDPHYAAWNQCNKMVLSWLLNSLSKTIGQSLLGSNTAREVWLDLHERLSTGDFFRVSDIQEEIFASRQGTSSVTEFFTRLKILWEELIMLRPIPRCNCQTTQEFKDYVEADYVIRFLMGLNDSFEPVKSKILLMNPLPKINEAYNLAIKLERQLTHGPEGGLPFSTPTALQSISSNTQGNFVKQLPPKRSMITNQYQVSGNSSSKKNMQCTYGNRTGHTEDRCYKKQGFPPGFQTKMQVNMVQEGHQQVASSSTTEGVETHRPATFSTEQYEEMIRIFQQMQMPQNQQIVPNTGVQHQASAVVLNSNFGTPTAGVKSVEINRKHQKVTVTGYVEANKVLKKEKSTGKMAEIWPYIPYNLVSHPYAAQIYDKKAPPGYVRKAENQVAGGGTAVTMYQQDPYITMFSNDNPNACSVM